MAIIHESAGQVLDYWKESKTCPSYLGSKLVSDYLTDQKRSLLDKRRQLVITDAQDRILWLIGERPDDRFRITAATTEILRLSI